EPVKEFADPGLPFKRVEILTVTTPALDTVSTSAATPLSLGGSPFLFHILAEDWDGHTLDFGIQLSFVPLGASIAGLRDAEADLRNQVVAFADSQQVGDTHLKTASMSFSAGDSSGAGVSLVPRLTTASVAVPAIDHLCGSSGRSLNARMTY